MNRIPVGYQVKIRRKWPRVVITVLLFIIVGLSYFLIKPNFNTIKNFFVMSGDIIDSVEVSDNKLNDNHVKVKTDTSSQSTSTEIENRLSEKIDEFIPINNIDETTKILTTNDSNIDNRENKEPIILTQSNVSDENMNEEPELVTEEKEINELDTLNLSSDTSGSKTEPEIETLKVIGDLYYVIVGSVKTKAAADIQQKKFFSMSESTDIIYEPTNDRYRISLGTYSEFKQASAKSKKFQSKYPKYKTWIWKTSSVPKE